MMETKHDEAEHAEPSLSGEEGYLHSHTTGSVVDGPGVRMVVWLTGCHLRCQYCHNPDTWKLKSGTRTTVEALMAEVVKYRRFMQATQGGLTLSGGEPLVQAPFVARMLRECKQAGIHTALDTNGYLGDRISDADLSLADLVMLDIKSWDRDTHQRVTGWDVEPVLRFARRLSDLGRPAWVRFVLVPGLTDASENVNGLADFLVTLRNIERVEVLPFHQMGRYKWEKLGHTYALRETPPPSPNLMAHVVARFRERGLNVI
jgi:pyruvate formate lyase activating enzyme